jgi:voltage-gated potassium channel
MSSQPSTPRDGGLLCDLFTDSGTPIRLFWQILQGILIFVSSLSMLLENYEPYQSGFPGLISAIELIAIAFLTVDYLGNLYFAPDRIAYTFSFWGIIDMLSVLPFYLMMLNPSSTIVVKSLRFLRFLRVLRIFRLARRGF